MSSANVSSFDFVIVGAGSAGCALAARLTENSQYRVCLVEAGGQDSNPMIHIPFGLSLLSRFKNINWNYNTAPILRNLKTNSVAPMPIMVRAAH